MKDYPVTLTIAGSDSGGGAGIQADLKTFSALETFGTTALTCLTAQNPNGVSAIHELPLEFVEQQLNAVLSFFPIKACKTGMLFSAKIISLVCQVLRKYPDMFIIVDPVMIATSGAKLLNDDAISILKSELIPLATVITPNLDEASHLLGHTITHYDELESSAKILFEMFRKPILLKGGHLPNAIEAIDILFDGNSIYEFKKPFIRNRQTHGTGCTYSSAITAYMSKGFPLVTAVGLAKEYIQACIQNSIQTGPISHLNHFADIANTQY